MKYDVFISYRRVGGKEYARLLKPELEKRGFRVFLDFDELNDGVFDQRIKDAISASPVFLFILSHGALDRCVNVGDWVREEILYAEKCHCHIIPVEFDKSFREMPAATPDDISAIIGAHSWAQIDTETLLQESIDKMVQKRIRPYVHHEEGDGPSASKPVQGIEIHIDVDADCNLFRFKTFVCHLKAGEDNVVHLNPGTYKLRFVSTEVSKVEVLKVYNLGAGKNCDFFEVELRGKINEMIAQSKAAEEARQNAEEAKRKSEEQTKRKVEEEAKHCDDAARQRVLKKSSSRFQKMKEVLHAKSKLVKWVIGIVMTSAFFCAYYAYKSQIVEEHDYSEGLAAVQNGFMKWGYKDELGKVVIPCQWKDAWLFSEGLAVVQDANGKWGYIDKEGEVVIPCQWEFAYSFSEGLARVEDANLKSGFIDKTGKVVIPCQWRSARDFSEGLVMVLYLNGKCGFIDKTGKVVIPCQWDTAYSFSEGLARVEDANGKWGYIDKTGEVVILCQWESAYDFSDGLALVEDEDGKYWQIDKTGRVIEGKAQVKEEDNEVEEAEDV